ncbi:hypothetical protein [Sulfobacillus sp. hq2]|uniref:hypothetical protein n=1 Tax=Sulfobacillus sp. hq2 TaxID=2039167 RepID=UPI000CD1505F|nr:hypothetical protein [Sulfobacillus sp. hq2]POB12190.1 hypothetical protein CO251_00760 [Sulfobacillus sp. hq2]
MHLNRGGWGWCCPDLQHYYRNTDIIHLTVNPATSGIVATLIDCQANTSYAMTYCPFCGTPFEEEDTLSTTQA